MCPECGLDFAASRAARVGSPWQRRPSLKGWLVTVALMVVRPRRTLAAVALRKHESDYPLFVYSVLMVPVLTALVLMLVEIGWLMSGPQSDDSLSPGTSVVLSGVVLGGTLVFWFLGASLMFFLLGRTAIRVLGRGSAGTRRGSGALVAHATCVFAPTTAVIVLDSVLSAPGADTPGVILAAGTLWFAVLCRVAARWPDRTPTPESQ